MQTVVIWDEADGNIKFVVLDGDYSRFDRVYINSVEAPEDLSSALCDMFYDEAGNTKIELSTTFPADAVRAGAMVIVAEFLP